MAVESKSKSNVVIFEKKKRTPIAKRKLPLSEGQIQSAFICWLSMALPYVRQLTFSIPNGGTRSNKIEAVNLKRQGLSRGIPDICCAIPNSEYHGFYIEFKAGKGKLSPEQVEKINLLRENGYKCEIFWDWEKAKDCLLEYLKGTKYV
jgi:hypothetical protein